MNIKIRDSRIESLRIVTVILILAHHAIQHGGESYNSLIQAPLSINQIWSTVIGSWGQLGVTIFLIISSWFLTEIRRGWSKS